jgi:hypothetical protein
LLAIDVGLFDRIIEVYRKAGIVKSAMSGKALCDDSFIQAALAS